MVDDLALLQERYEKFAAILEQHDYPDLRYWLYVQLAMIARENRDAQDMAWITKAYETACAMKEERLINAAAALRLWLTIEAGQFDHEHQIQLKELLDYFEPHLPDSFVTYCILLSLGMSSAEMSAYEKAFHYGKRALNIAKSWRELLWISSSDERLARAYLQQNLPQEAGWQLLDSLEWHLAIGQNWQMLGFIGGAAIMYPQLVGGQEVAIELLSLLYHHPDLIDKHRRKIKTQSTRLQAELGHEAFAAAWEKGKELDIETAVDQLRLVWT